MKQSASVLSLLFVFCLLACAGGDDQAAGDAGLASRTPMSLEQAKDPAQCKNCHPNHYREWASSMHAYASKDPVFVAMNKRGQRETDGQLGDFCLKCHAPMAVMDHKLQGPNDNLTELPAAYQGVTCYTCHNTISVEGEHNATLHLANDVTMRGPIRDPKQPIVHRAAYAATFDDHQPSSNALCGGCHDIVTPSGVHLERTFEEYKTTLFAKPGGETCAGCHMDGRENQPAADDAASGVGLRTVHEHLWPGVDVALTDFPDQEVQRLAVQCALATSARAYVDPNLDVNSGRASPGAFGVTLETQAGHRQPSGASQDRRLWWEMLAYDSTGALLSKSSGPIADGEIEDKPADDPTRDPQLWMFHDRIFDAAGQPTHNFWETAPSTMYPKGYSEPLNTLPAPTDPMVPHYAAKTYRLPFTGQQPGQTARVVGHLRMRPMGMDVLEDLVASGDLDPSMPAKMPTFTLAGTEVEWKVTDPDPNARVTPQLDSLNCPNTYLCLLQPGSNYCNAAHSAP
jgi:nitrate/TMAO reductase-like tetraheme cytochrome c subunit